MRLRSVNAIVLRYAARAIGGPVAVSTMSAWNTATRMNNTSIATMQIEIVKRAFAPK